MRWITHLDGGPRRVNHAAVALTPNLIYSFGGYCSGDSHNTARLEPIDVHVLNTTTLRWYALPPANTPIPPPPRPQLAPLGGRARASTSAASTNYSAQPTSSSPSSSSSGGIVNPMTRGRARSVAELHPLGQLRLFRPPIHDEDENMEEKPEKTSAHPLSSRLSYFQSSNNCGYARDDEEALLRSEENAEMGVEDESMDPSQLPSSPYDSASSYSSGGGNNSGEEFAASLGFSSMSEESEDEDDTMGEGYRRPHAPLPNINAPNARRDSDSGSSDGGSSTASGDLQPSNPVPYQRYGHTVVAYKGKAYLWGGRNDEVGSSHLIHEYDPVTNTWSIIPVNSAMTPPSRDGHSAVVYGDSMLVFGGYEEHQHRFSQECYAFHFATREWELVSCGSDGDSPPQHRDFHTAVLINDAMYVFGGRSDELGQIHSNQDIYCPRLKCLDLKSSFRKWIDLTPTMRGDFPSGRRSHSAWVHNGRMYLFGGYHSIRDEHFNDLYEYNPAANTWRRLKANGECPTPRRRQCTVGVGNRVFLFGGTMPHPHHHQRVPSLFSPSVAGDGRLLDLADLHVLDYSPSLATLCLEELVRQRRIDMRGGVQVSQQRMRAVMPRVLWKELEGMSRPNSISKVVGEAAVEEAMNRVECNNG